MIYLDNNATTMIDPEVLEAMLPYLKELYGNPSGKYLLARQSQEAVNTSRQQIAQLLNADPGEIIFTSGASESNNFILKGVSDAHRDKGNHIITSAIEHKSILETCHYLETKGFTVTYLPPTSEGIVTVESLQRSLTEKTILASISWVNNELGTINDIPAMANFCAVNNVFFHTDATQAIGKVRIDLNLIPINFLSFSGHKIYAPKGVGGCFIRKTKLGLKEKITPIIHGGSQEFGYRAGTLAVPNIVGLGKAADIAFQNFDAHQSKLKLLDKELHSLLIQKFNHIKFNGCKHTRVPGITNFFIPNMSTELIIKKLSQEIAVSNGSACSASKPSHVLQMIGLSLDQIRSSIRISMGKYNTPDELAYFVNRLAEIVLV